MKCTPFAIALLVLMPPRLKDGDVMTQCSS